jgi:hypothetical protein
MNEPTFTAQGSPGLYWMDGAGTTAGFWAGGGSPGAAPTLTRTWAVATGTYLFPGANLGDADAFATSLAAYLAQFPPGGAPRWLWIANPAAPMLQWMATPLFARAAAALSEEWTVSRRADFAFGGYTLLVRGGGAVAPACGGEAGWGFTVADPPGAAAGSLLTPEAAMDARPGSTVLGMEAATAGCWRFALDMPAIRGQGPDAFARLGCGIRYFIMPEPGAPLLAIPFTALRQPPDAPALPFYATLDPLRPFDTGRSHLGFFSWSGAGTAPKLHTGFATPHGHGVDATPQPSRGDGVPAARLVFAFAPGDAGSGSDPAVPGSCYLAPEGGFALTVCPAPASPPPAAAHVECLLCGFSGMEYLRLPPSGLVVVDSPGPPESHAPGLVFVAGKPAYAALAGAVGAGALSPLGTTSWVYARAPRGTPIRYYAQPEDAPLFATPVPTALPPSGGDDPGDPGDPGSSRQSGSVGFLDFLEIAAGELPPPDGRRAFPMAPYRGLDASLLDSARILEQRALAPCRRAILAAIAAPRPAPRGEAGDGGVEAGLPPMEIGGGAAAVLPAGTVPDGRAAVASHVAPSPATPPLAATPYADGEAVRVGVTPQGIAVGVAADGETWAWVGIGQAGPGPAAAPDLRFTVCEGEFRQAMLTNNLFLVLGNAEEFGRCGSVAYRLTAIEVGIVAASPAAKEWPSDLVPAVRTYFSGPGGKSYPTRTDFDAALLAAYPAMTADQQRVFRRAAGELNPVVEDWTFRLSPDHWSDPGRGGEGNTYLIFKFVLGRSLAELAGDLSTWAWPAAASPDGDPATAQKAILRTIARDVPPDGLPPLPPSSPYHNFARVVNDPNWTGILALGAEVPLDTVPGPLQVLAAGIDPRAFRAHHVGMSATPYTVVDGQVWFDRTSLFGLIDYENMQEQYFAADVPFAFRVMRLTVGFQNSAISSFASRAHLMVNRLFGSTTRLFPSSHGNNVVLEGAYQQQRQPDGSLHDAYVFSMPEASTVRLDQRVLQSAELLSVQLLTSSAANPKSGDDTVRATFRMAGNLRFFEPPAFDPFCWGATETADGWLRFGNLAVEMAFSLGDPAGTTVFSVQDGGLSFDLANSVARPDSLAARFPVRLTGLVTTPDTAPTEAGDRNGGGTAPPPTPESMGYVSVRSPLDQSLLSRPWYGLVYTIDLGTLGALAGSSALSLSVLAAWSPQPDETTPLLYLGVRLPGSRDAFGVSLPLQGILNLGFRAIEWLVDDPEGGPRTYTLRMRDFAVRFLGLTFPPGHNDIYLFGNPDQGSASKVGWYAAYAAEDDRKKPASAPGRQSLRAARSVTRALPPASAHAPGARVETAGTETGGAGPVSPT